MSSNKTFGEVVFTPAFKLLHGFMGLGKVLLMVISGDFVWANALVCSEIFKTNDANRVGVQADSNFQRDWLNSELKIAQSKMLANISPVGARRGAIVASPSRSQPNYYYHWVRDAGITVLSLLQQYQSSSSALEKSNLDKIMRDHLEFSEHIQNTKTISGLPEPKYNADGSAFNEPWGRPQSDGPALRAISFIQWIRILKKENRLDQVSDRLYSRLYNGRSSSDSVIKKDLEYISHHWREPSFDLWEEVLGDHFYTRMVQRRALIEGAHLANDFGDSGAADWYLKQAREIEADLGNFWDPSKGYFIATRNRVGGFDYKNSGLDIAVILGLLHGSISGSDSGGSDFLTFRDPKVQMTMEKIVQSSKDQFGINRMEKAPGLAIFRYPEDRYSGIDTSGGNPWVLCTLAIAEAYFRTAAEYQNQQKSSNEKSQYFTKLGSYYVNRVGYHANPDGSLSEQMDRDWGYMKSAVDLTWNYAAIISTSFARAKLIQN